MIADGSGGADPQRLRVPWRTLLPTILVPNLVNSTVQGIAVTAAPLAASQATGSYALAATVTAMLTLGQLASTLPAGWLVDRWGERASMLLSAAVTTAGGMLAAVGESVLLLGVGTALIGAGVSVFAMARHAWITVAVPPAVRGRTLSAVAGTTRLGILIGPFLVAGTLHAWARPGSAFLVVVVASVLLFVGLVLSPDFDEEAQPSGEDRRGVFATMRRRRAALLQLGLTVAVISAMRTGRRVLVPLIGVGLGWQDVSIALLIGVAGAFDFAVCYVGGALVDRWGPVAVGVACLAGFGCSNVALAFVLGANLGVELYVGAVVVMAVANGVSGGLVPAIGSDLADPSAPAAFLSSWRLVTDAGGAAAPVAVAVVAAGFGLAPAALLMAAMSCIAGFLLPRYAARHLR